MPPAVLSSATLTAGFVPTVLSGGLDPSGFDQLTANPTPEVAAQRAVTNYSDAQYAGTLVLAAFFAVGSAAHAAPGSIEVPLRVPLCERVNSEIRRAFQSSGFHTENMRITAAEKENHIELSWSSPTVTHSSW